MCLDSSNTDVMRSVDTPILSSSLAIYDAFVSTTCPIKISSPIVITSASISVVVGIFYLRSEEHTSELQSRPHLVCRLLLEKKKTNITTMGMIIEICPLPALLLRVVLHALLTPFNVRLFPTSQYSLVMCIVYSLD